MGSRILLAPVLCDPPLLRSEPEMRGLWPDLPEGINGQQRPWRDAVKGGAAVEMKALILVGFLTVAMLCLCRGDDSAHFNSVPDSPNSEAFISRRDSAEVVKRQKKQYSRFFDQIAGDAAHPPPRTPDPLEPYREICEYNVMCDELADHIGFQEAYRRFYGPLP